MSFIGMTDNCELLEFVQQTPKQNGSVLRVKAAEMNSYVHYFSWFHIELSRSTIVVAIVMFLLILAMVLFMYTSELHPYDRLQIAAFRCYDKGGCIGNMANCNSSKRSCLIQSLSSLFQEMQPMN